MAHVSDLLFFFTHFSGQRANLRPRFAFRPVVFVHSKDGFYVKRVLLRETEIRICFWLA